MAGVVNTISGEKPTTGWETEKRAIEQGGNQWRVDGTK